MSSLGETIHRINKGPLAIGDKAAADAYELHRNLVHYALMKFSRPVVINTVLIVVIVIIAASVLIIFNPFGGKNAAATTQLTGTVEEGVVSTTITASGNIAPVQEVNAAFGASGTVASVNVALGDTVTAGEVLGTLQTADLSTAVTNAKTNLYHDNIILDDDYSALSSAESSPQGNVEQAQEQVYQQESTVAQAETTVTTAEEALADATLTAPIGGLVIAVNDQVGDTVSGTNTSSSSSSSSSGSSGTGTGGTGDSGSSASSSSGSSSAFVTIADTSKFIVTANIAEADIANVKVGQTASITFPAISSTATSPATVTAIAPTGTTSNSIVTYATTITLTSPPAGLRIGQTADVTITTEASKPTALYVPAAAITTEDGTSTVKVVKNGKTSTVEVTTGIVGDNGTQITSGLTEGETIVIGSVSTTTTTTGTTGTGTTGTGTTGGFGGGGFGGGGSGFGGGGGRNFGGGGNG
jgi:membrane fusion protein, macrolide-specific efflux system